MRTPLLSHLLNIIICCCLFDLGFSPKWKLHKHQLPKFLVAELWIFKLSFCFLFSSLNPNRLFKYLCYLLIPLLSTLSIRVWYLLWQMQGKPLWREAYSVLSDILEQINMKRLHCYNITHSILRELGVPCGQDKTAIIIPVCALIP